MEYKNLGKNKSIKLNELNIDFQFKKWTVRALEYEDTTI